MIAPEALATPNLVPPYAGILRPGKVRPWAGGPQAGCLFPHQAVEPDQPTVHQVQKPDSLWLAWGQPAGQGCGWGSSGLWDYLWEDWVGPGAGAML